MNRLSFRMIACLAPCGICHTWLNSLYNALGSKQVHFRNTCSCGLLEILEILCAESEMQRGGISIVAGEPLTRAQLRVLVGDSASDVNSGGTSEGPFESSHGSGAGDSVGIGDEDEGMGSGDGEEDSMEEDQGEDADDGNMADNNHEAMCAGAVREASMGTLGDGQSGDRVTPRVSGEEDDGMDEQMGDADLEVVTGAQRPQQNVADLAFVAGDAAGRTSSATRSADDNVAQRQLGTDRLQGEEAEDEEDVEEEQEVGAAGDGDGESSEDDGNGDDRGQDEEGDDDNEDEEDEEEADGASDDDSDDNAEESEEDSDGVCEAEAVAVAVARRGAAVHGHRTAAPSQLVYEGEESSEDDASGSGSESSAGEDAVHEPVGTAVAAAAVAAAVPLQVADESADESEEDSDEESDDEADEPEENRRPGQDGPHGGAGGAGGTGRHPGGGFPDPDSDGGSSSAGSDAEADEASSGGTSSEGGSSGEDGAEGDSPAAPAEAPQGGQVAEAAQVPPLSPPRPARPFWEVLNDIAPAGSPLSAAPAATPADVAPTATNAADAARAAFSGMAHQPAPRAAAQHERNERRLRLRRSAGGLLSTDSEGSSKQSNGCPPDDKGAASSRLQQLDMPAGAVPVGEVRQVRSQKAVAPARSGAGKAADKVDPPAQHAGKVGSPANQDAGALVENAGSSAALGAADRAAPAPLCGAANAVERATSLTDIGADDMAQYVASPAPVATMEPVLPAPSATRKMGSRWMKQLTALPSRQASVRSASVGARSTVSDALQAQGGQRPSVNGLFEASLSGGTTEGGEVRTGSQHMWPQVPPRPAPTGVTVVPSRSTQVSVGAQGELPERRNEVGSSRSRSAEGSLVDIGMATGGIPAWPSRRRQTAAAHIVQSKSVEVPEGRAGQPGCCAALQQVSCTLGAADGTVQGVAAVPQEVGRPVLDQRGEPPPGMGWEGQTQDGSTEGQRRGGEGVGQAGDEELAIATRALVATLPRRKVCALPGCFDGEALSGELSIRGSVHARSNAKID
jgi:hypothetical protein